MRSSFKACSVINFTNIVDVHDGMASTDKATAYQLCLFLKKNIYSIELPPMQDVIIGLRKANEVERYNLKLLLNCCRSLLTLINHLPKIWIQTTSMRSQLLIKISLINTLLKN